jgi:hypothetical protein
MDFEMERLVSFIGAQVMINALSQAVGADRRRLDVGDVGRLSLKLLNR